MTVREILCKARKLLSNKENWLQGTLHSRDGSRHCALGALWSSAGSKWGAEPDAKAATGVLEQAARTLYRKGVAGVNDHLGYEATLKMYDKALEIACEREDAADAAKEVS